MKRSKLIFLILSVIFIIIMILIAMDFSSRTRFPGDGQPVEEVDTIKNN
ncbi:MAG: hypothetical protein ABFS32_05950 [Bacteroidota bacterium]